MLPVQADFLHKHRTSKGRPVEPPLPSYISPQLALLLLEAVPDRDTARNLPTLQLDSPIQFMRYL